MNNDLFSVKDKIIVITGGGQGIGEFLALELSKRGANIFCVDKKFKKTKERIALHDIICDVTNLHDIKKTCMEIFKTNQRIDVLINNAGITLPENSDSYSLKSWQKTLDVNLTGAFLFSQKVLNLMKRNRSGSIINITSINAELGFPRNPAYVASKGGLKMLGKALAKDWGKYRTRVNNLGPGYIRTDMTKSSYSNKKLREERAKHTMLGRWGDKDDLVGPCIFLASDASRYITGQDVYVDGGWLANSIITE